MASDSVKYVVLFGQVAHDYVKGDVVTEAQLGFDRSGVKEPDHPEYGKTYPRLARYLALGAVRPATPDEAGLDRVTLDEAQRPTHSLDAKLAQAKRAHEEALGRAAQQESEAAKAQAVIRELEARLTVAEKAAGRLAELEAKLESLEKAGRRQGGARAAATAGD